jgi:hypothetical protein
LLSIRSSESSIRCSPDQTSDQMLKYETEQSTSAGILLTLEEG